MMNFQIRADGSFSIRGKRISLADCYPSVSGTAVRPLHVSCDDHTIGYQLPHGQIRIDFDKMPDGSLAVRSRFEGLDNAHDFSPLGDAVMEQVSRIYVQGFGMEGPSGIYSVNGEIPVSYGLTGLAGDDGAMIIYAKDHRHYSAIFNAQTVRTMQGKCSRLSAGFNLEGTAAGECEMPALYFAEDDDLPGGLRKSAEEIAAFMGARTNKPPAAFWCSWYHAYETLNQQSLEYYLEGLKSSPQFAFQYVEIDAGYTPHLGDWLITNGRYPEGLKKAADTILEAGYQPGIWIGPFIVGDQSQLFKAHPDWVLKNKDGSPYVQLRSCTEPKIWGNPDSDYYVLDVSHPEAFAYLENVFKTFRSWGFTFFKTDFLFWNMHDTSEVQRYDDSMTSVQLIRKLMTMVRRVIGEDSYLLGCIAPFMPLIGLVDGMRIAGDGGARWAEPFGPVNLLRELPCDNYFNHVFWQNDPDCLMLRDFDTFLNDTEVRSLALFQALSGGAVSTSDPFDRLGEDRKQLLSMIWPKGRAVPELPYLDSPHREIVMIHHLSQGGLLFVLNPTEEPLTFFGETSVWFEEDLRCQYRYQWEKGAFSSSAEKPYVAGTLKPHESVLYFLSKAPLEKKPANLWDWS